MDERILKLYALKTRLGQGAFGIVWKAVDKRTSQVIALKIIHNAFSDQQSAQKTFREVMFLRALRKHPNIVKLIRVHVATNKLDIYLVFEYIETDLDKLIRRGGLQENHKRYIMYQLLKAMMYIHSGNVIHRDLKPSNILLHRRFRVRIADFGLARSIKSGNLRFHGHALTRCGTVCYLPPELHLGVQRYTHSVDIWSLGCILAEMLSGRRLFSGNTPFNLLTQILSTISRPTEREIYTLYPEHAKWLISRISQKRHPLAHLLQHAPPDGVDLVSRLLVFNPNKRLTAAQALRHPYVARYFEREPLPVLKQDVIPPVSDNNLLRVDEYRHLLQRYEASHNSERRRQCNNHPRCQ